MRAGLRRSRKGALDADRGGRQPDPDALSRGPHVLVAGAFLGFGLLSPRNGTVLAVLFVCAISVAAAMLIILDLNQPFDGLIRVSIDPIRDALAELNK